MFKGCTGEQCEKQSTHFIALMRQTQLWILMKVKAVIGIAWAQSSQRNLHDCVCKLIQDLIVFTNEEIKDHPILQRTTQAHDPEGHRESVCVDELLNALTAHEPWLKLWWNWQQPLTRTESPMSGFHQEFRFKFTWMYEGKVINECMATHVWCMHNNYKGISTGLPDGLQSCIKWRMSKVPSKRMEEFVWV